jgi:hypothetical protein
VSPLFCRAQIRFSPQNRISDLLTLVEFSAPQGRQFGDVGVSSVDDYSSVLREGGCGFDPADRLVSLHRQFLPHFKC